MKTFTEVEEIVVSRKVRFSILDIFHITYDFKKCTVASCIVQNRNNGQCYLFGEKVIAGGSYYKAIQCDEDGKIKNNAKVVNIASLYLRGEFVGYILNNEDVNISY